jgi:hypothetical protein
MSSVVKARVDQGYVSSGTGSRDAADLRPGELAEMSGAFYRKNDPSQVWKMPGRAEFGDTGTTGVKGIAICQFDEGGTDRLIALAGTTLYAATPGLTGSFSSLVTGLNSSATTLTACHQDDRWFIGNGYDTNRVLKSDGTTRLMGMQRPGGTLSLQTTTVPSTINRPTISESSFTWVDVANSMDGDETTFAYRYGVEFEGQDGQRIWRGFPADAAQATRTLRIRWAVAVVDTSYLRIEKSENGGSSWTTIYFEGFGAPVTLSPRWLESEVTANSSEVQVRVTFTANTNEFRDTVHIYDINIAFGSDANVTTTDGIYYAYTEYNVNEDLESAPSALSAKLTLASKNQVIATRPATVNSSATHWYVYRIGDGVAATYDNLGRVSDRIDINTMTWADDLATVPITEQALPIVPLITVGDLLYFRDTPPPAAFSMISWKGSICILSRMTRRAWYYSEGGRPESFPSIYAVLSFPLDEHDILIGQMAIGETLALLCTGAILAIDDVPRVTDGVFNPVDARALRGHPGCVGEYAYTTFSVRGEPRGAWVSPFGVYITNGTVCECISTDLAWEAEVNVPFLGTSVLRWDAKNLILWFNFDLDGDGLNDHEMPFHMADAHQKYNGSPKLGQPTGKATSCMASALIDSAHYRYSGHPSNGEVYVEEVGTEDAATATEVEMAVKTGQISSDLRNAALIKATLNHSDFGSGETGTMTVTAYRDTANTQNSREISVRVDGNRGTTVGVARAGELFDLEFVYSGDGTGGIGGYDLEMEGQGRAGSAPRVSSTTATP